MQLLRQAFIWANAPLGAVLAYVMSQLVGQETNRSGWEDDWA